MPLNISEFETNSTYLKLRALEVLQASGNGHLGACLGASDLFSVLYCSEIFHFNPECPFRDRVLVRGHLGPLRYSLFAALGWIEDNLLASYRKLGTSLQGHEDMNLVKGVDITPSGCLGNLLSYGIGAALALNRMSVAANRKSPKVIVFLGDGEEQEGAVSEAARLASNLGLDNLICILDANGAQLTGRTESVGGRADTMSIWKSYGWKTLEVDGHNATDLLAAYSQAASNSGTPMFIHARTVKGHGAPDVETSINGYHTLSNVGKNSEERHSFLCETRKGLLQETGTTPPIFKRPKSTQCESCQIPVVRSNNLISWQTGTGSYSTIMEASDDCILATASVHKSTDFIILNADTFTSTRLNKFNTVGNIMFVQCGLREQAMLGVAHGYACTDKSAAVVVDVSEPFLVRAFDQVVATAQARLPIKILSFYAGLCGNENGSTHQPSFFANALKSVPNLELLELSHPDDVVGCLKASSLHDGPSVMRIHSAPRSEPEPVVERYPSGNAVFVSQKQLHKAPGPTIAIVAAGLVVRSALMAKTALEQQGVKISVVKCVRIGHSLELELLKALIATDIIMCVYNGASDSLDRTLQLPSGLNLLACTTEIIRRGFDLGESGTNDELLALFGLDEKGLIDSLEDAIRRWHLRKERENG